MPNKPITNLFWFIPWCIRYNANKTKAVYESDVKPFLAKHGIEKVGVFSFCWGATAGIGISAFPEVKCHVGFHPSTQVYSLSFGPSMEKALSEVVCPQIYLVAKNDQVSPGGDAEKFVKDKAKQECVVHLYENQVHGWVNRGDVSVPGVKDDVEKALHEAEEYFNKYLA